MVRVYQSRWGYHTCAYETFQLLKELNVLYEETLRRFARWKRWSRKQPQNRLLRRKIVDAQGNKVGTEVLGPWPEPRLCPVFCKRQKVVQRRGANASGPGGSDAVELVQLVCREIPQTYRIARKPVPSPDQLQHLAYTPEEIRALLAEAEAWYCQEAAARRSQEA